MFTMEQYADMFTGGPDKMVQNAGAMAKMWMDMASRLFMTGMSIPQGMTPPEAGREMRSSLFKAMSEKFEEYMRSPQFLEMSRQTMDNILSFRKQFDEFLTQVHHDMQGVARDDIASLHSSLRHIETRLLDRIEDIQEQLDELGDRLERMETLIGEGTHSRRQPAAQKPESAAATKSRKSAKNRYKRQG